MLLLPGCTTKNIPQTTFPFFLQRTIAYFEATGKKWLCQAENVFRLMLRGKQKGQAPYSKKPELYIILDKTKKDKANIFFSKLSN